MANIERCVGCHMALLSRVLDDDSDYSRTSTPTQHQIVIAGHQNGRRQRLASRHPAGHTRSSPMNYLANWPNRRRDDGVMRSITGSTTVPSRPVARSLAPPPPTPAVVGALHVSPAEPCWNKIEIKKLSDVHWHKRLKAKMLKISYRQNTECEGKVQVK